MFVSTQVPVLSPVHHLPHSCCICDIVYATFMIIRLRPLTVVLIVELVMLLIHVLVGVSTSHLPPQLRVHLPPIFLRPTSHLPPIFFRPTSHLPPIFLRPTSHLPPIFLRPTSHLPPIFLGQPLTSHLFFLGQPLTSHQLF